MSILEVAENGTLTVPAEALGGAPPRTKFRLEHVERGVLLRAEGESDEMHPDEWLNKWDALSDAVSAAWHSDKDAVEIVSEMRR